MATVDVSGWSDEAVAKSATAFEAFANRYRVDPAFRAEIDRDPDATLRQIGFMLPPGVRVQVAADTDTVMHVLMPPDPNLDLSDEALDAIAGGDTTSTNSSASTGSTAMSSCMPSSVSTLGSASTYQE